MNDQETLLQMAADTPEDAGPYRAACLAGAAAIARVAELEADRARLAVDVDSMRQQAEQARKDRDEATMEAAEAVLKAESDNAALERQMRDAERRREASFKRSIALEIKVRELEAALETSRQQEQIHADNCAKAEAENVRLREALDKAMDMLSSLEWVVDDPDTGWSCPFCGGFRNTYLNNYKREAGHTQFCRLAKLKAALTGPEPEGKE
jgi:phage shock protein A